MPKSGGLPALRCPVFACVSVVQLPRNAIGEILAPLRRLSGDAGGDVGDGDCAEVFA